MMSRLGIAFMRWMGHWPLPAVRALGWGVGCVLYCVVPARRKVVQTNLLLCFPEHTKQYRRAISRQIFIKFAQAWLDRGWLWHGTPALTRQRLRLVGDLAQLQGQTPTVLFAPHFVGLDAGATALSQQVARNFSTIFTPQSNKQVDTWIAEGR
ncbi:MAG: hypothetical protein RLZZ401_1438, partial [Pseudomonadota bacterium]